MLLHTLKTQEKIISPYLSSSNLTSDKCRGEAEVLVGRHTKS